MKRVWVTNADGDQPAVWWGDLKIGLPKPNQWWTTVELVDKGIIGLYTEVDDTQPDKDAAEGPAGLARTGTV